MFTSLTVVLFVPRYRYMPVSIRLLFGEWFYTSLAAHQAARRNGASAISSWRMAALFFSTKYRSCRSIPGVKLLRALQEGESNASVAARGGGDWSGTTLSR
jgi:hypothetical protein